MKKVYLAAMIAGMIAVGFSIYPQVRLRYLRGADFNGAFATYDLDEMAYAAYLQALIDGRPRRNDPYTGRDDSASEPQAESIFSIQSATAYPVAIAARTCGVTAAGAMPAVSIVSAFLVALSLFALIYLLSGDAWMSLAGTVAVIAGGALISNIGAIAMFAEGGVAYPYPPLFRRHIPSLSFPFLLPLFALLFAALRSAANARRTAYAAASVGCFGVLLFSYFYLWTSAFAVLGILGLFLLIRKDEGRSRDLRLVAAMVGSCGLLLVPYAYLLSKRNPATDAAQLLVYTHSPDLWRNVEIIGTVIALVALLLTLRKIGWVDRVQASFICGFGLSAFVVFNQQILTGHSLQPFHYEYYSVNYVVLLSAVLICVLVIQRLLVNHRFVQLAVAVVMTLAATGWGAFEVYQTSKFWDDVNIDRDATMPVNSRLRQLAENQALDPRSIVTLNLDSLQGDSQPTVAPFAVLWARHQNVFAGISNSDESKLRYYKLIYFSGLDDGWLRKALTGCSDIEACMTLFGWDRFNPTLSANARGLTPSEIDAEVRNYARFVASFDANAAYSLSLKYLVSRTNDGISERLAEWYDVGLAETFGEFTIRELTPRHH